MTFERCSSLAATPIRTQESAPPVEIPPGHVGPVVLPGSGRLIWWTGRVAIGLRHQPERRVEGFSHSAQWLQGLLLGPRSRGGSVAQSVA